MVCRVNGLAYSLSRISTWQGASPYGVPLGRPVGLLTAAGNSSIHTKGLERTKFQAFRDVMCGYRTYNELISGDPETVSTVRRIAQRKLEEELFEYVVTDSVYSYRL